MKCPRPKPGASVPPYNDWGGRAADLINKKHTQPVTNANLALHMIVYAIFIAHLIGQVLPVAIFHLLLRFRFGG
jgi:hypothetical protein